MISFHTLKMLGCYPGLVIMPVVGAVQGGCERVSTQHSMGPWQESQHNIEVIRVSTQHSMGPWQESQHNIEVIRVSTQHSMGPWQESQYNIEVIRVNTQHSMGPWQESQHNIEVIRAVKFCVCEEVMMIFAFPAFYLLQHRIFQLPCSNS